MTEFQIGFLICLAFAGGLGIGLLVAMTNRS